MDAKDVLTIIQEVISTAVLAKRSLDDIGKPIYGFIHDKKEAEIRGIRGFLVWDFIVWNEITFDCMDGNIISFFTSGSDEETQTRWNELVDRYGI